MAQKIYRVTKPLLNLETNETTQPGSFIEMDPEIAETFLKVGALELTKKKSIPNSEEE